MDFAAMFKTSVKVLTHPDEQTFESEKSSTNATLTTALIWIVLAAIVTAILGFLRELIFGGAAMSGMPQFMNMDDRPPEAAQQMQEAVSRGTFAVMTGSWGFLDIILVPVFFLIGVGTFHLLSKLMGGQGQFDRYAYLIATFQAPISIANALLAFMPVLGGCVGALVSIYSLVLAYFATKVNYNLTSGKTLMLFPLSLLLTVVVGFIAVIVGIIFSGVGGG